MSADPFRSSPGGAWRRPGAPVRDRPRIRPTATRLGTARLGGAGGPTDGTRARSRPGWRPVLRRGRRRGPASALPITAFTISCRGPGQKTPAHGRNVSLPRDRVRRRRALPTGVVDGHPGIRRLVDRMRAGRSRCRAAVPPVLPVDDGPAAGWCWPLGRNDLLELGPEQLLVAAHQVEKRIGFRGRGRLSGRSTRCGHRRSREAQALMACFSSSVLIMILRGFACSATGMRNVRTPAT